MKERASDSAVPPATLDGGVPASRYAVFALLAIGGAGADLWTKHVMFAWTALGQGRAYWLVDGYVGFQRSLNEGALFGLGQGGQHWFALMSVIAGIAILAWLFYFGQARDWASTITLGLIAGGVVGNLYDRLGLHRLVWGRDWPLYGDHQLDEPVYAVRDWILLQAGDAWRWPNFNIADALLVVGAGLLFMRALKKPEEASTQDELGAEA